jgi:predicted GNAT family N-acyltransferase
MEAAFATGTFHVRPIRNEREWQAVRAIRQEVFVEEQACAPEEEWDSFDDTSRHFLGFAADIPVATARWRTASYEERIVAKLERFAVRRDARGLGYGRALVRAVIEDAEAAGFPTQFLHAQAHLEAFYRSFEFQPVGDPFTEAGIPHQKMIRRPDYSSAPSGGAG